MCSSLLSFAVERYGRRCTNKVNIIIVIQDLNTIRKTKVLFKVKWILHTNTEHIPVEILSNSLWILHKNRFTFLKLIN